MLGVVTEAMWQMNSLLYLLDAYGPAVLVSNPRSGKAILAARGVEDSYHDRFDEELDAGAAEAQPYLVSRNAIFRHSSVTSIA